MLPQAADTNSAGGLLLINMNDDKGQTMIQFNSMINDIKGTKNNIKINLGLKLFIKYEQKIS